MPLPHARATTGRTDRASSRSSRPGSKNSRSNPPQAPSDDEVERAARLVVRAQLQILGLRSAGRFAQLQILGLRSADRLYAPTTPRHDPEGPLERVTDPEPRRRVSNICDGGAPTLGRGVGPPGAAAFRIEHTDPEVESLSRDHPISGRSRRGREEASEVACRDGEEGASQAQAAKEDLARQIGRVRYASASRLPAGIAPGRAPATGVLGRLGRRKFLLPPLDRMAAVALASSVVRSRCRAIRTGSARRHPSANRVGAVAGRPSLLVGDRF